MSPSEKELHRKVSPLVLIADMTFGENTGRGWWVRGGRTRTRLGSATLLCRQQGQEQRVCAWSHVIGHCLDNTPSYLPRLNCCDVSTRPTRIECTSYSMHCLLGNMGVLERPNTSTLQDTRLHPMAVKSVILYGGQLASAWHLPPLPPRFRFST